jgi:hypothetical protein
MHDKYKRGRVSRLADARLRRQIATEAARQLLARVGDGDSKEVRLDLSTAELSTAKRQAVSLLGQRVRESDLPSDSEVREQLLALRRSGAQVSLLVGLSEQLESNPIRLADHLERFTLFQMRLAPLEFVKLDRVRHPEGDALYHSLQVFEHARAVRPYDEEFLLAALLHHVGSAIDGRNPVESGLDSLKGTIGPRTAWLIENLPQALRGAAQSAAPRWNQALRASEYFEDLLLLLELDLAARVPGAAVSGIDEALHYLRQLELSTEQDGVDTLTQPFPFGPAGRRELP